FFFFQAEDGIRDDLVTEFRRVLFRSAGRMMSSTLGRLTKLDHAVNTALMLSYVAIAKGDEVGLLGFADTVRAYDPARRGHRQFQIGRASCREGGEMSRVGAGAKEKEI